jgi:hypothetical protein
MIINLLATWIPALLIALLGVLKLTSNPRVAEEMSKLGVGRYLRLLGVMEIAFAALFVVPATMKLGFILAYCSGSALSFGIARFFSDMQLSDEIYDIQAVPIWGTTRVAAVESDFVINNGPWL